jgi:CheY-like chemotaxis protein/uncharacterized protein YbcI
MSTSDAPHLNALIMKQKTILSALKPRRVLIVDDSRDGADALGLLVEELGNVAYVTYSGAQALDVAAAFRADLLLIDLVMPEMNGCDLARRFRQNPAFSQTKIVAITGHNDAEHATLALKTGFETILLKPVPLNEIKAVLESVVVANPCQPQQRGLERRRFGIESPLPTDEFRRNRSEGKQKTMTKTESEAIICNGVMRFQDEYLGWSSEQIQAYFIDDLLLVRIHGALTLAERRLGKSVSSAKSRDLIKQVRMQLLELARTMMESLIHEVTGVKVSSMHHDLSIVTGEEVVLFSLVKTPVFA